MHTISGAFGYFEVTHDISKYCKAKVFSHIGKKTPIAVRFSTVGKFISVCITVDILYLKGTVSGYKCIFSNGSWMRIPNF